MTRIGDNNPERVSHTTPTTPSASFAKLQASSGNVGKVSRQAIDNQGKFKEVADMYEGHMQKHTVTKGFDGASVIPFPHHSF